MLFTRKDFYFSITTGLITGIIAWRILKFLWMTEIRIWGRSIENCRILQTIDCQPIYSIYFSSDWLILLVPVLWILGVNLGYFLGRWFAFFNQFGKFAAVGFTNAAVYFGILNFLISWSGFNKGLWYSVFVAVAFVIATSISYFWNKFWVFSSVRPGFTDGQPDNQISGGEFGKFLTVSAVAGLVNVGTASSVVNLMNPVLGLTLDQWANVGGVAGSAVALVFSFIGFKLAVFKK